MALAWAPGPWRRAGSVSYTHLDVYKRQVQLNLADDYFKARKKAAALEAKVELLEKEIYSLKHELVTNQMKYEKRHGED